MLRWVSVGAAAMVVVMVVVALVAVAADLPDWLQSEVARLPLLRPGDQGDWVVRLQLALQAVGLDPGPVDGNLGPMTQEAVRRFQASSNLTVDGLVGTETWQALAAALLASQSHPPDRELAAGDDTPVESIPGRADTQRRDDAEYVVQKGDTLASIARRFSMSIADLMEINDISDPDLIKTGQVILVKPRPGEATAPAGETGTGMVHEEYVVQKGDTLAGIARQFNMSVADLMEINDITDPDLIKLGQILMVQPRPGETTTPAGETGAVEGDLEYIVQRGDTLAAIARRFSMSVADLIRINDLPDPDVIRVGQVLLVVKPQAAAETGQPSPDSTQVERTWHEGGWFTYLPPVPAGERDESDQTQSDPGPASGVVALTFNDGPDRTVTGRILEILAVEGIQATFFVVGQDAATHPDLVRRMNGDGHQVENHSYTHPDFTSGLSWGAMRTEISRTADLIESLTGRRPRYFRPPHGSWDQAVAMAAAREDHQLALWSNIGALDFPFPGREELVRRIGAMAFPGAIIMLHANLPDTTESLPLLISTLRDRGFGFATLDQLPGEPLPALLYTGGN